MVNIAINENIITYITNYICNKHKKFAIINGGKRPLAFINNNLIKKKLKTCFYPTFFTNESFINYIIFSKTKLERISDFEAILILFKVIQNAKLHIIDLNVSFLTSIEWIREILLFIEQLDLEDITDSKLKFIEANATIGYDIPININLLLKNISYIRQSFHNNLDDLSKLTKGYAFLKTSKEIDFKFLLNNFDEIIVISPFYLYQSEINILKKISNNNNLTIFIHGDPNKYNILKELYSCFKKSLPSTVASQFIKNKYKLNIYSASDNQTQSALVKNLISNYSNKELDSTAIVILDSIIIQSLITEISTITNRYNLTTGYQIEKTSMFVLINLILEAQLNRKRKYYYLQNIVDILNNPIVRNIKFDYHDVFILHNVMYKFEEYLSKYSSNLLRSMTFISLKDIINNEDLINTILNIDFIHITSIDIIKIITKIFNIFFTSWEQIDSFEVLTDKLSDFVYNIQCLADTILNSLDFNIINIFIKISKNLHSIRNLKQQFTNKEILIIFQKFIRGIKIPLAGTSFKGIQILGLLETRNLSFNNVFIIGMIDSAIPCIKKDYPLIPVEIMNVLGLKRIEKQLEIQKYHFYRLINNSKNIHLIYPDTEIHDRSRFIESIIWNKQLKDKNFNNTYVKKFIPSQVLSNQAPRKKKYFKTKHIRNYLKNMSYTYSKINIYLLCKLKFYFMYVLSLDNKYNISYDDRAENYIGNFIHNFLKDIFHEGINKTALTTHGFNDIYISQFIKNFKNYAYFKFRSDAFIIKEIIKNKMLKFLDYDIQRQYKRVYASEQTYTTTIQTNLGNRYKLTCRIDRIDQIDNKNYIILDYKTGTISTSIIKKSFFNYTSKINRYYIRNSIDSLQLPLYKYIFEKSTGMNVLMYGIYDIKNIKVITFPNIATIYDKCLDMIKFILDEINTIRYFEADQQDDYLKCNKCEYLYICR
jgi:hypothetical protein